jgi:hypothetical protein
MADQSDFLAPLAATGSQGLLREALVSRVAYVIADTENPTDFVALDVATGGLPWALIFEGRVFALDPDDTTTANDGISTIVTNDGYRYKVEEVAGTPLSVLDKDTTAPPTTPSFGDAYLVLAGATGDWASHPDDVAIWTARGWSYVPPEIGALVFVEDELGFYHYTTAGDWVSGIGSSVLAANSVRASQLMGGRTHWVIVNQTTNTPPGSPTTGVAYIVGPSPTGAWAGRTGQVAVWEVNAWTFYSPLEGWTAYDQAQNIDYYFNGSWLAKSAGYDQIREASADATVTPSVTGSSAYAYSATAAPTRNNIGFFDPLSISLQAAFSGQSFDVSYIASQDTASASVLVVALFVDSEANARDWQRISAPGIGAFFRLTLNDVATHTVSIRIFAGSGIATSRRRILSRRRSA